MMKDIDEEANSNSEFAKKEIHIDFFEATRKLSEALLSVYQKPLEDVKTELADLTSKQEICIKGLQNENKKLCDVVEDIEISDLFFTLDIYQKKLANIKKEMINIHERTNRLKKKAMKLQQQKQKEVQHKEQRREQELRREEQLIGKMDSMQE